MDGVEAAALCVEAVHHLVVFGVDALALIAQLLQFVPVELTSNS